MDVKKILASEQTLDPKDWEAVHRLGHEMVDEMMDYLSTVNERPVWRKIPDEIKRALDQPLPETGVTADDVYDEFTRTILPYPLGNIHPRFWGWVIGTGTATGMLAEMLAAGMNPNVGGADHAAVYVETQVLNWCKTMLGYPDSASGLLVSGGSMANLLGLAVGRNTQPSVNVRKEGARGAGGMLTLYCSTETHSSIQKAVELLGLGSDSIRKIPVDAQFKIKIPELRESIKRDKSEGHLPFCIVGNAGTVNTGAFDDLPAIADICEKEGLWFHADGAFGAMAALLPEYKKVIAGMERADSLAFDLHKWMYIPYEAGCILIKNPEIHQQAFAVIPDYLAHHESGIAAGPTYFSNLGFELSRGFKALKVWFAFKEYGMEKFRILVRQNIAQARYLASLIEADSKLELLAPVPLNVVCFRFTCPDTSDDVLNDLNRNILMQLHERGIAAPTFTIIGGNYAIRMANTNHRSRKEDFDALCNGVKELGNELSSNR